MKQKYIKLGMLIFTLCCWGCSDFLKESSLDEIRPSTTNDLEQLLLGEGYLRRDYLTNYLDLLTDDIDSYYAERQPEALSRGAFAFSWQPDMYEQMTLAGLSSHNTWQKAYAKIKGCNVILDMLDKVDGKEEEKLNLRGQALGMRAFYYFILVNLYGQPYHAEGVDITRSPGVPLVLSSVVKDEFLSRASVAEVYAQIEKDLLTAAPLLDKYGKENYILKVTDLFVHTLLSRMYLYMEEWEKAAEHASYVIERKPMLVNLMDYTTVKTVGDKVNITADRDNGGVYDLNSVEMIWGYSGDDERNLYFSAVALNTKPAYCVSTSLKDIYEKGDLRTNFFYERYITMIDYTSFTFLTEMHFGAKSPSNGRAPRKGMRVAELYLNRAEANIRLYLENQDVSLRDAALKDLNFLRSHRFLSPYTEVKAEDVEDLLDFCLKERRRELSFEDHRWYDLRRCGMPEIKHVLTLSEGNPVEYVLPERGKRYVLPIPQEVLDRNPALVQNP